MLDLYKPFTEAGSMPNYFIQLRNFISQIQLFRTIESSDIELDDHYVTFKLDKFGLFGVYIKLSEYYYQSLQISTNIHTFLGSDRSGDSTTYMNCRIFTLQTGSSAGFWLYTPDHDISVKVILTPVVNLMNPLNTRYVMMLGTQTSSSSACYIYYNQFVHLTIPTDIKYGQSSDIDNFIVDQLNFDTYKCNDVYILSGGNTSDPYLEVMRFASNQYIQLAGNIYIKDHISQA